MHKYGIRIGKESWLTRLNEQMGGTAIITFDTKQEAKDYAENLELPKDRVKIKKVD